MNPENPPLIIHVDIESQSSCPIKNGPEAYARHKSTKVLCMAYQVEGDENPTIWTPGQGVPEVFTEPFVMVAHNYRFEQAMWDVHFLELGFIEPVEYFCTMALAMANNMPPALDDLGARLHLPHQKDKEGEKVMKKMMKPSYKPPADPAEAEAEFRKLCEYCKDDVRTEFSAYHFDFMMSYSPEEFELDRQINNRGWKVDLPAVKAIQKAIDQEAKYQGEKIIQRTNYFIDKAKSPKLLEWLQMQGYGGKDMKAESVTAALESPGGISDDGLYVLRLRQRVSLGSTAKFKVMNAAADPKDHRVRGLFQYLGASQTGRFAGRLVQAQNLPRMWMKDPNEIQMCIDMFKHDGPETIRTIYSNVFDVAKQLIRPMFIADENKKFIVSDLSQIECRMLAWMAGCRKLIEQFQDTERDPYSEMAVAAYGGTVAEHGKGSPGRFKGKTAVLGCGYGLGGKVFAASAGVTEEEGNNIVGTYRREYSEIPRFWSDMGTAFESLANNPAGPEQVVGPIRMRGVKRFGDKHPTIVVVLPSGRKLTYPNVHYRYEMKENGSKKLAVHFTKSSNFHSSTWGGVLTENVVQAAARDCLMRAMLTIDQEGIPIVGHVHDEVIVEVDEGSNLTNNVSQIMSDVPEWAEGLPLDCETDECMRYTK